MTTSVTCLFWVPRRVLYSGRESLDKQDLFVSVCKNLPVGHSCSNGPGFKNGASGMPHGAPMLL